MESTPTVTLEELTPAVTGSVAPRLRAAPSVPTPLPGGCARSALAPTEQEVALLTAQYHKALDGLYEAYKFGQMLLRVKERLESDPHGSPENQGLPGGAARGTARCGEAQAHGGAVAAPGWNAGTGLKERLESDPHGSPENQGLPGGAARGTARCGEAQAHGGAVAAPGWNAGTGLKGWLAEHCPEINYSTARRFLSVAENTNRAILLCREAEAEGAAQVVQGRALSTAPAAEPSEAEVRAYLEGKSQRSVLRRGGAREGSGRKAKDYAAALDANGEVAWKEIEEPLAALSELIVSQRRHTRLSAADLETLRAAIDLLHERVHADA